MDEKFHMSADKKAALKIASIYLLFSIIFPGVWLGV